jgi:hypothetical protein
MLITLLAQTEVALDYKNFAQRLTDAQLIIQNVVLMVNVLNKIKLVKLLYVQLLPQSNVWTDFALRLPALVNLLSLLKISNNV